MNIDYTTKLEGSRLSQAGIIARCPVCSRLGERRPHDAKSKPWLFVHAGEIRTTGTKPAQLKIIEKCSSPQPGSTPLGRGEDRRAGESQQEVLGRR